LSRQPRYAVVQRTKIGQNSRVYDQVNLYGCEIGENTKIDAYVYIEEGVRIGNNCKIRPFVFIPTGVTIEDNVFVAPGVMFTNDKYPRANGAWKLLETRVRESASIGAGCVINPGVTIGRNALVGAGAVVTHDVPDNSIAAGNPARVIGLRNIAR
jgi:UDP-2-acetamido-3-amino-2,3-dideoxy-glucuronate N-acetyltransferase